MTKVFGSTTTLTSSGVKDLDFWAPPDPIGEGALDYLWDARALVGQFAQNADTTSWTDVIGGVTLTPAGYGPNATAPKLIKDAANGNRWGVQFTASALSGLGSTLGLATPHTVVIYGRQTVVPVSLQAWIGADVSSGSAPVSGLLSTGARVYQGGSLNTVLPANDAAALTPGVLISVFGGATSGVRWRGVGATGDATGGTNGGAGSIRTKISLGGYSGGYTNYIVYAVGIYTGFRPNGDQYTALEGYTI